MSSPIQQCQLCGRTEIVKPDGRGFPPDITKRKLIKLCKAMGCPCEPRYTAGFVVGAAIRGMADCPNSHMQHYSAETEGLG